jgi:hypothetical protein
MDRMYELESRLIEVEEQLKNLLTWQFNLARAAITKFPFTPADSPKLSALALTTTYNQNDEENDESLFAEHNATGFVVQEQEKQKSMEIDQSEKTNDAEENNNNEQSKLLILETTGKQSEI